MYVQCLISMVIFFTYDNLCISAKMFLYTGHFNVIQEKINCKSYYKTLIEKKNYTMKHFDLNGKYITLIR